MLIALTLSIACMTSLAVPPASVICLADEAKSAPIAVVADGAVIEVNGPIGIVRDQGMTADEFRESLKHVSEKGFRRVVLDLTVPAGRVDSIDAYIQAIDTARRGELEVFAFVREASAEGWCVALSCDQWVATEAAIKSLQAALKANAPGSASDSPQSTDDGLQGQGNKGMQGRRKPPAGGGQMPGMGQGLGLSGGGEGAEGGGDWAAGSTTRGWPAPTEETLERLRALAKAGTNQGKVAVADRAEALKMLGTDAQLVLADRFCVTQRELRDLAGAVRRNESELKKQSDALKSVKQKDGPRAESLKKLIDAINSRLTDLQVKMAALRSKP